MNDFLPLFTSRTKVMLTIALHSLPTCRPVSRNVVWWGRPVEYQRHSNGGAEGAEGADGVGSGEGYPASQWGGVGGCVGRRLCQKNFGM